MIEAKVANSISAMLLALASCLTAAQADVPAGTGNWSTEQTWGTDPNHGNQPLKGFYYWPRSQPALAGKRALIVTLHGCSQTAFGDVISSASDGGFNWPEVAERYGAVIVAPNATGNVQNLHCWDYYGREHDKTSGHVGVLLDMVKRFKEDPKFAIDPNQVYVTGLSSGGGEAMVLGCVAPDIFAGVGNNAGPALGTTAFQIGSVPFGFDASTAAENCQDVAPAGDGFSTQIMNAIFGTSDFLVTPAYASLNVAAMQQIYGGSFTKLPNFSLTGGGLGQEWEDANGKVRVSLVSVAGMAHAWPAGPGGQNSNFVDGTRVDYPEYISAFFFENNLRVARDPAPVISSCNAMVAADKHTVTISGAATDNAMIAGYELALSGPTTVVEALPGGSSFSKTHTTLADGFYSGTVTATDEVGQVSEPCNLTSFLVGEPPPILPPTSVTVTNATSSSISLSWTASSNATGYNVFRDGAKVTAIPVPGTAFVDAGLPENTTFSYTVSALGPEGESAPSSPAVPGRTKLAFVCTTTTSSNFAHVQAGRAHDQLGRARANGSNQDMGLNNVFFPQTLAQTAPGFYVIGDCP
jgi:poly(3-hydroxybutyrate) depolymerase